MESTFNFNGKSIHLVHTQDETSVKFTHNNILHKIEVIGASNNKRAKEILVEAVLTKRDIEGNLLTSERVDYLINNEAEYLMFYNIATVINEGLGFTEYMHALNGATYRSPLLQERFFNADGTLKQY
jgi:hypothetical protein